MKLDLTGGSVASGFGVVGSGLGDERGRGRGGGRGGVDDRSWSWRTDREQIQVRLNEREVINNKLRKAHSSLGTLTLSTLKISHDLLRKSSWN